MACQLSWASYPRSDMGKLKMKISKRQLEATKKKTKRKKQSACSRRTKAVRPNLNAAAEPSPTNRHSSGDSPSQEAKTLQPGLKIRAKKTNYINGSEDSSTIRWTHRSARSPTLMTRHDRSLLREMTLMRPTKSRLRRIELEALGLTMPKSAGRGGVVPGGADGPSQKHIYKKAPSTPSSKNTNDMIVGVGPRRKGHPHPDNLSRDGGQEDMEITSAQDERMKKMPSREPTVTPSTNAEPTIPFRL
ncbi:hypothetical protein FNV43_RR08421 [Rhamnella rubrinervis]|uniref:Uncharacterized protein n=1 Tax=Rhamnella rubrinervis TaxID=2594499 RepID=A0A8K0H9A6_9ROSA|nr:hypothetical protein FNV43_RR08421 [Rhamnella rubrinervis]